MIESSQIPSTGRRPAFQVKQMGYKSVSDFANSIPKKAKIADVGAGYSKLGEEVAELRKDITWINIDTCYESSKLSDRSNVKYINANIISPDVELYKLKGKLNLLYSYWLLPHLSLESEIHAKKALNSMRDLLSADGLLIAGPIKKVGLGLLSPYRYKGTAKFYKKELNSKTISSLASQTKLWWLPRYIQLISNRHNIHIAKLFVGGKINR